MCRLLLAYLYVLLTQQLVVEPQSEQLVVSNCVRAARREQLQVSSSVWAVQCEQFSVSCTVWAARREQYSVSSSVWAAQCERFSVSCTVWAARRAVQCEQLSVNSSMWSVQCEQFSVSNFRLAAQCVGSSVWAVQCEQFSVSNSTWAAQREQLSVSSSVSSSVWKVKCQQFSEQLDVSSSTRAARRTPRSARRKQLHVNSSTWIAPREQFHVSSSTWAARCKKFGVSSSTWAPPQCEHAHVACMRFGGRTSSLDLVSHVLTWLLSHAISTTHRTSVLSMCTQGLHFHVKHWPHIPYSKFQMAIVFVLSCWPRCTHEQYFSLHGWIVRSCVLFGFYACTLPWLSVGLTT